MIKELYDTFIRAWIRFWDNRFLPNLLLNEIEYLKLQVDKERIEKQKLLNYILELNQAREPEKEIDTSNYKPVSSYVPWRTKRAELEKKDKREFEDKQLNNSIKKNEKKSTEQLEKEILEGHD